MFDFTLPAKIAPWKGWCLFPRTFWMRNSLYGQSWIFKFFIFQACWCSLSSLVPALVRFVCFKNSFETKINLSIKITTLSLQINGLLKIDVYAENDIEQFSLGVEGKFNVNFRELFRGLNWKWSSYKPTVAACKFNFLNVNLNISKFSNQRLKSKISLFFLLFSI